MIRTPQLDLLRGIAGTPTTPGSYTFTLRATNSYGTADKSFTIVISTAAAAGSSWAWVA